MNLTTRFYREHQPNLTALGVICLPESDAVKCNFTVAQARAFMLLNVFMHELGHHRDRQRRPAHGLKGREEFAEDFAQQRFENLRLRYVEVFGDPATSIKESTTDGENNQPPQGEAKATIRAWGHKPVGQ